MRKQDIKPGDEVRVFDHSAGRHIHEYPGEVIKTGRTLVTITYGEERPYRSEARFRMDTGRINDNYGGVWFKTLEQAAADERAEAAEKVLHEAGIEFRLGWARKFTLEQIEALAEVVRKFGTEEK